jgi:uncharacterized protein (TIGR02246 family)
MSEQFDEVKLSLDRYCTAWKANNGTLLSHFFAVDGSLIDPFGGRADGRGAVAAMYDEYFSGMLHGTSTTFELVRVRPVGQDGYTFIDGEQTIHAADGSLLLAVHLAALMRREGDDWQFVDARPYAYTPR